jgi:hypothetical protein
MITYVVLIFTRLLNYGTVLRTVSTVRYRSDHTKMNGTVLDRLEQRFGSGFDPDSESGFGSGSRRAKMTHKN